MFHTGTLLKHSRARYTGAKCQGTPYPCNGANFPSKSLAHGMRDRFSRTKTLCLNADFFYTWSSRLKSALFAIPILVNLAVITSHSRPIRSDRTPVVRNAVRVSLGSKSKTNYDRARVCISKTPRKSYAQDNEPCVRVAKATGRGGGDVDESAFAARRVLDPTPRTRSLIVIQTSLRAHVAPCADVSAVE